MSVQLKVTPNMPSEVCNSDDLNSKLIISQLKTNPELFWHYWLGLEKRVFNYCLYRLTKNFHDAEDLSHDTMLKAYQKLPEAKSDIKLQAWLFQLARNHYFDQLRKNQTYFKYQATQLVEEPDNEDEMFNQAVNKSISRFIEKTIKNMPEKYRIVALDYFFNDKSYKQISQEQAQTEAQIRKLIFRTRKYIVPLIFDYLVN
ncbi:RNA polymerase sigma factor [Pseudoalteromonas ostreae]|uniref:RNA polymerase sigma factor n=1 Tax=Pseudoalteromonas ostreae TaxID=2774154 RepID=UPI001B385AD1|nr:RNA polymerase sigma factor [Pseudoalteromonas ostreae]